MRIVHLVSWYPRPNSQNSGIFFRQLAEGIADTAEEVIVACIHVKFFAKIDKIGLDIRKREKITEYMWFVPSPVPRCRWIYNILGKYYMNKLIKLINKKHGKIDVIHIQSAFSAGVYAMPYLKKNSIPIVYTEHSSKVIRGSLSKNDIGILKEMDKRANAKVAVSQCLANELSKYVSDIRVIGNMLDIDVKMSQSKEFTFVCLGTLRKAKGIDLLIKAFINEFSPNEKVSLIVGGEGEYQNQLETLVKADNNRHNIRFVGAVYHENVGDFYSKGNCFVLPSRYETFGIVYIEAMACGLPVIATRCGGPEELVNKENGILIDVDNEEQLRKALRFMYENINNYDSLFISEKTVDLYGKRSICEAYNELYKRL